MFNQKGFAVIALGCALGLAAQDTTQQKPSLGELARQQREAKEARQRDENKSGSGISVLSGQSTPRDLKGMSSCGADLKCLARALDTRTPAYADRSASSTNFTMQITQAYHWELRKFTGDQVEIFASAQMTGYKFDVEAARRTGMKEADIAKALDDEKGQTGTITASPQEGSCTLPVAKLKNLFSTVNMTPAEWQAAQAKAEAAAKNAQAQVPKKDGPTLGDLMQLAPFQDPQDAFLVMAPITLTFLTDKECHGSYFGKAGR